MVGTISKPKPGTQPSPAGEAGLAFWQGGDFIKDAADREDGFPEVVKAKRMAMKQVSGMTSDWHVLALGVPLLPGAAPARG